MALQAYPDVPLFRYPYLQLTEAQIAGKLAPGAQGGPGSRFSSLPLRERVGRGVGPVSSRFAAWHSGGWRRRPRSLRAFGAPPSPARGEGECLPNADSTNF